MAALSAVPLVSLVLGIVFLSNLAAALRRCHKDNRAMAPGEVWLNRVPFLSVVWTFVPVNRVVDSLEREYRARGLRARGEFGRGLGVTWCVLNLAAIGPIPCLSVFLAFAGLLFFVAYWV